MTQFGITAGKSEVAVQAEMERFKAPRPVFQAPSNSNSVEAMTPKVKENAPSPSLATQANSAVNEMVRIALLAASQAAKTTVPDETGKVSRRKIKSEKVVTTISSSKSERPVFDPEDVCDDRTFIVRTRSGDYHTPEMKRLFWANGGERHMVSSLTYAQAFSNLRTEKMRNLRK